MESVNIKELNERIQRESSFVDLLSMEMGKVIVGQKQLIENLLIGLLADGHILLEGVFMVKPCGYQITKGDYSDNIRMNEKDKLLFMFQKSMSSK